MKGPRTNQFDAPTSFMTSISRRRAKMESRIVFPIRIVAAIRSTTIPSTDSTVKTRATCKTLSAVFLAYLTSVTPGGAGASELEIAATCSPFVGLTSKERGSGLPGRFSTSCGYFFSMTFSASSFETKATEATRWSDSSRSRTAFTC